MYVALLYIYCFIINFACHIQMPKYLYEKPRHFFLKVTLPKLQRLNKITKSVKGVNLETN